MGNSVFFAVAVLSVVISAFSQILLKMGANKDYPNKIREYLNPYVIGGYSLFLVTTVLTLVVYSGLDYLSLPIIVALGYILVPVLSYLFFRERFSPRKVAGILCILAGVLVYHL